MEDRLARSFGCETVDVSKGDPKDQIEQLLGVLEVDGSGDCSGDCSVDCVGFEARGHGPGSASTASERTGRERGPSPGGCRLLW